MVVDDRSDDGTAADRGGGAEPASSRPIPSSGPAGARNLGTAATDAEVLAFTDADCEPDPSWLSAALAEIAAGADLVTGPIEPVRAPGPFEPNPQRPRALTAV